MPDCPSLPRCPFFNDHMANRPATTEMMKKKYCLSDNSLCARWMVCSKKGKDAVPADLFPNQTDRIQAILA
jgi:hypothetical protein